MFSKRIFSKFFFLSPLIISISVDILGRRSSGKKIFKFFFFLRLVLPLLSVLKMAISVNTMAISMKLGW